MRCCFGVLLWCPCTRCEVVASAAISEDLKTSDTLFEHERDRRIYTDSHSSLSQCDEGVPTCRNCQKSKRECLGYDPIFKQQPSPANIQPAPSIHNTPSASTSAVGPNIPPNAYGAPHAYPGTGGTFIQAAGLPHGEQPHFESHYGNGTSLDPALSTSGDQPHHMAHQNNNYPNTLQPTRRGKH